jgi:hypothetical protein
MPCITTNIGTDRAILCISKVDFRCPVCDRLYTEKDYYKRLDKSKSGVIYKKCSCGFWLGITVDYRGDVRVWRKDEEQFGKTEQLKPNKTR